MQKKCSKTLKLITEMHQNYGMRKGFANKTAKVSIIIITRFNGQKLENSFLFSCFLFFVWEGQGEIKKISHASHTPNIIVKTKSDHVENWEFN